MKKPNWEVEQDYNYTANFQPTEWAWEFLRRNPKYKEEYAVWHAGELGDCIYSPDKKKGETIRQWQMRCIDVLDVTPQMLSPAGKWGLLSTFFDPTLTAPELATKGTRVKFNVDVTVERYELWDQLYELPTIVDETNGITAIRGDRLVVALDLSGPMTPQVDQIKAHFKKAKSKISINTAASSTYGGKPKSTAFKQGIRALDALELGVSNHMIGEVIFQGSKSDTNVAAHDCIKSARYNSSYGYRAIARRRTPIPK